jgi:hypothetical protein
MSIVRTNSLGSLGWVKAPTTLNTITRRTKKMIIEAIQLKMPFNRAKNQDHMRFPLGVW